MRYPLATPEDLEQTVKSVEALDRRIIARKADVRERNQLQAVIDEAISSFGRLDVVVANAGICPMADPSLCQGFVDVTDVDLIGVMNTVAVSLPHLQAGASIVITGSTAGLMKGTTESLGPTGGVGYAWAKRVITNYVEVLALQLAPHMVRMNAIHPTNCDTDILHNDDLYRIFCPTMENPTKEDAAKAFRVMQAMPIPWIDPLDVSHLVAYLASDESRYMTGLNLRIDGGAMLKGHSAI